MLRYSTCIHCGEEVRLVTIPGEGEITLEPYPYNCGTVVILGDGFNARAPSEEEWKTMPTDATRFVRHLPVCEEYHFGQVAHSAGHIRPGRN